MASFTSCPEEIQGQILSYVLTVPPKPLGRVQGLAIDDGVAKMYEPGIFRVNHRIRQLAKEISLTHNRVVVVGDPEKNLKWFEAQPEELLHKIRQLDLLITGRQYCDMDLFNGWEQLVSILQKKLMLENLELSIDGCLYYESLVEDEEEFEYLKPVYEFIMKPFGASFAGSKSFFVYWPLWRSLEAKAEQHVKGEAYDSIKRGKIPYKERDPRLVHGWEWEERDANGGIPLAREEYRKERMLDCEVLVHK